MFVKTHPFRERIPTACLQAVGITQFFDSIQVILQPLLVLDLVFTKCLLQCGNGIRNDLNFRLVTVRY